MEQIVLLPVDLREYDTVDEQFFEQICCYLVGGDIEILAAYIEECASLKYPYGKDDTLFRNEVQYMWGVFNSISGVMSRIIYNSRTNNLVDSCFLYSAQIKPGYVDLCVSGW